MVAFIFSSPFSIFYSGDTESTQNGITLTSAIDQINSEFSAEIERIKSENPHDEVEGITTPQNWKDVLAVYAVKYSADPDNPTDVATIDNEMFENLKTIFWDMNIISFTLETVEPGSPSEEPSASEDQVKTILHITVQNKSCSEMAAQYTFGPEQNEQLNELLKPEYNYLWDNLLNK